MCSCEEVYVPLTCDISCFGILSMPIPSRSSPHQISYLNARIFVSLTVNYIYSAERLTKPYIPHLNLPK